MVFNSQDMALRGRIGGFARAAKYSPEQLTGPARIGFLRRFWPDDVSLSDQEKVRRAQAGLNSYMASLARQSALSRRRKKRKNSAMTFNRGESARASAHPSDPKRVRSPIP